MGRDNRNEMRQVHRKKGKHLREKLGLIRKKLGVTITPNQWEKTSPPVREQLTKAVHPERFIKPPQPVPAPAPATAPQPVAPAAPASPQPTGKTAPAAPASAEPKKK